MDISVVIPCYNAAPWLRLTLQSALHQRHSPAEVIVVDDGSTDDSYQIFEEFTHRITVIQQPNAGLGAARNAGVAAARAQWVAFLDADDLYLSNTLDIFRLLHRAFPAASVLFGDFTEFDEKGLDQPHASVYLQDLERHVVAHGGPHFLLRQPARIVIDRNGAFTPSCLVVRRDVLNQVGGFDESRDAQGAEDLDLYFRLIPTEAIAFTRQTVVHKRRHAGNMSRQSTQMRRSGQRALARAHAFYTDRHPTLLPIVEAKSSDMLESWAIDDLKHCRAGAHQTIMQLLKRRPTSLRAWRLLSLSVTTSRDNRKR
jgi:glycosyltransferase involved in cell wall biosynthesis